MATPNIFDSDLFTLTSLTAAINNLKYKPGIIGSLGLFQEEGISTLDAWVEEQDGVLELLDVKARNAPGKVIDDSLRTGLSFRVPHIPEQATISADEVQGVRQFGTEDTAQVLEGRVNRRLQIMRDSMEYTIESHRLLALKGTFKNANNADESLFTKFGVSQQTTAMALGTSTTKVETKVLDILEKMESALDGVAFSGAVILCGSTFWEKAMSHDYIRETYLNQQAANSLRGTDPRMEFEYAGARFIRYRGTSAVKVADAEGIAVPMGVNGLFLTRYAPANYMETVNTEGLPFYSKAKVLDFDKGVQLEAQSNPLNICTRPASIIKLTTN